jgi:hypothetical protein
MVTIEVNERTKAGRALLATARLISVKNKGVEIITEDSILVEKMKNNRKGNLLSTSEKNAFLESINKDCE